MKRHRPKVNVFNRQRQVSVEMKALRNFLDQLSSQMVLQTGFSVVLVSDVAMKNYNHQFRGEDRATDVLSFSYEEDDGEEG